MRQALRRVLLLEPVVELDGQAPLVGTHRRGVPFRAIRIVDGHERGLAAHGEAHIARQQLRVDGVAQAFDLRPLLLGVRLGDARRFPDALDLHVVVELDFGLVDRAGDRRRGAGLGRAGQRNVAFARQQAGGGIESDPARARQIDFAPGMQVGEILLRPRRAIERFHVGGELDQVAGDEARRQAQVTQQLHQQPRRVAARTGPFPERELRRLHARLHADEVLDVARRA